MSVALLGRAPQPRRTGIIHQTIGEIFSVEASFILFLFAGLFKALPELNDFPIDFTILFSFLSLTLVLISWCNFRITAFSLGTAGWFTIFFGALAFVSLCWSSGDMANFDKAQRFLLLTMPSFFIAQMIGSDGERRRRFGRMLLIFSFSLLIYYVFYRFVLHVRIFRGEAWDNSTLGGYYLEHGYNAQIVFISCLIIATSGPIVRVWPFLLLAFFTLYLLLDMGGRGPLVGAVMAFVIVIFGYGLRGQPWTSRLTFLASLAVLAGMGYWIVLQGPATSNDEGSFRTLWRLQVQVNGEDTSSMDGRRGARARAVEMWLREPFLGQGLGEYVVEDRYLRYPHNLPLEVLAELGAVGFLLFLGMILPAMRTCFRVALGRNRDWSIAAVSLIFIVDLILHCTVKGYLADDRAFFAYAGLLVGYGHSRIWIGRAETGRLHGRAMQLGRVGQLAKDPDGARRAQARDASLRHGPTGRRYLGGVG